ncbi:hypothetical protein CVE34_20980 [Pseudomonas syringae pv. actinidiae]|nr:hypothetical protein [Pseudomonas syringae pv. actinidiae]NAT32919.1 hypothetical protein [Pseudomonas syringae pv. actinidiae]NAT48811.1 hypothetical protein [Pseudomonas syringae pv. actinidiae]NAT55148.1 hypothetical protein [Pseudomonas syringae pv. actinidiae]NAT74443.1 hypothetical protein [Pseudomonas syringae pv. actinidiae]
MQGAPTLCGLVREGAGTFREYVSSEPPSSRTSEASPGPLPRLGQNQKHTCVQRASLVWERTCPRRRWFERFNFDDCNDPFADKSAPTER